MQQIVLQESDVERQFEKLAIAEDRDVADCTVQSTDLRTSRRLTYETVLVIIRLKPISTAPFSLYMLKHDHILKSVGWYTCCKM